MDKGAQVPKSQGEQQPVWSSGEGNYFTLNNNVKEGLRLRKTHTQAYSHADNTHTLTTAQRDTYPSTLWGSQQQLNNQIINQPQPQRGGILHPID